MKKQLSLLVSTLLILTVALTSAGCKQQQASLSNYFKSTDWVAEHTIDDNFVIVDTRSASDYAAGHIPGAISIPRTTFYFGRTLSNGKKIAYDIPTQTELSTILTANGITPDTTVVAYDTDTSSYGGRFPWVLGVYGHQNAYVIDGGADKWKDADGRAWVTTPVTPTPSATAYKAASTNKHRVTKDDLLAVIDTANGNKTKAGYVISDVRTPSEYTGFATTVSSGSQSEGTWDISTTPFIYNTTAGARPGHVPYAKFSDYATDAYTDYLDKNGGPVPSTLQKNHNVQVLKSEADLKDHFEGLGITSDKIVYNYCEGGFRSGVYTLILLGLGYPNVYNYDHSWNEWSILDDAYPVVTDDGRDGSNP
jgi:thiosulfate/3-mercaptopyruvate sulfurtransferase